MTAASPNMTWPLADVAVTSTRRVTPLSVPEETTSMQALGAAEAAQRVLTVPPGGLTQKVKEPPLTVLDGPTAAHQSVQGGAAVRL